MNPTMFDTAFNTIFSLLAQLWNYMTSHYFYYGEIYQITFAQMSIAMIAFGVALSFFVPWAGSINDEEE